jgi:hypothetical protein
VSKVFEFGERVEGYDIPVLNEREIRAAAGLLFLATYTALLVILLKGDFVMFKVVITFFLGDFLIRVFVNPKYAPTLILGRLIVHNQVPEYVGAKQKYIAWIIGVVLSATMFIHMVWANLYGPITGIICLICLIFLFFEAVFGICLGCKFYSLFFKDRAQYCPGEVCERRDRQAIQKTSLAQLFVMILFFTLVTLALRASGAALRQKPRPFLAPAEAAQANDLRQQ